MKPSASLPEAIIFGRFNGSVIIQCDQQQNNKSGFFVDLVYTNMIERHRHGTRDLELELALQKSEASERMRASEATSPSRRKNSDRPVDG